MLSTHIIERCFRTHRLAAILKTTAAIGPALSPQLQQQLSQSPIPPLALALRRLIEMSYGPTPLSRQMTSCLLAHQCRDGSFEADALATAAAAATFSQMLADPIFADPDVHAAHRAALAALAAMQSQDGLFRANADLPAEMRAETGAYVLTLLACDSFFRGSTCSIRLAHWFKARTRTLAPPINRLWQLSCASQPSTSQPAHFAAA